ncbi:MAG: ATP-binding protein [Pirellulaceae bacterium]
MTESGDQHVMWIGVDITARRTAEARAVALRQSTDAIIDTALDAVITFDPRGRVTAWNEQAESIFGWKRDDAIGENVVDMIIPARHRRAFAAGIHRFLGAREEGSAGTRIETEGLRFDGTEFPVELSISSVTVDDTRAFAAFARDISQRKQTQAEILRARDQAQAASRAKSEFLANMSHELRTPLTAILGYAEILGEDDKNVSGEHREALATIHHNGSHLLGLINDVLDLSKIEAGKLTLGLEPTNVCTIIADVADSLEVRSKAKGIELCWSRDDLIPDWVLTDPVRLRQILMNLVGNAIKFTEIGRVSVHVGTRVDLAQEMAVLEFAISDTGIGMSESQAARLFAPFEQVDTSAGRKFGGTGLGLAISHRLATLLGGEISVESTLDQGSTFTLSLPAVETERPLKLGSSTPTATVESCIIVDRELRPKEEQRQVVTNSPLGGLNVLLVEDGPDNQRLISFVLRKYGAIVTVANDGMEALEMFGLGPDQIPTSAESALPSVFDRRGTSLSAQGDQLPDRRRRSDFEEIASLETPASTEPVFEAVAGDSASLESPDVNEPFDFVLTDIQMPRMDGYSLTTLLRAAGCRIPIVALTAHAMNGEREKCLTAGCDGYATKPIDRAILLETCQAAIAKAAERIQEKTWI